MKKLFQIENCSKKEYQFLYDLYKFTKNKSYIHNLSKVKVIPLVFQIIICLGMKYCLPNKPNINIIKKSVDETIRKIAWKIHFKINEDVSIDHPLKNWYINNVKDYRNINNLSGPTCILQSSLADTKILSKCILNEVYKNTRHFTDLFSPTIKDFKEFLVINNLLVVEADKNAGVCIVNQDDYDNEVLKQLRDLKSYFPTTQAHFGFSMIEFRDKIKIFDKIMPENYKLGKFLIEENKPASFYILPKIHKPFEIFPKGRPISSTYHKTNKYASKLLDFVLKPSIIQVDDLLIDTQHLLLLLDNVKLSVDKKYTLVTVDVEALYPSLSISDCKRHCIESYLKQENKALSLTKNQFKDIMSLSLDYNYVTYKNELFYQHRGIEMGNAASVSVANITVFNEINNIFQGVNEIIFMKRFLDDILMIVENEKITDMDDWLKNLLKHRYLKFTYEHDCHSINFLDVTISLDDHNNLCTTVFSKPMSRHLYLHANSNHPIHLKNSLFYSQGLRIIRICSNVDNCKHNLLCLYDKFKERGYNVNTLNYTLEKLFTIDRNVALYPKGALLQNYLSIHNPHILVKYKPPQRTPKQPMTDNTTYAIFPFYECIKDYKSIIINSILNHIHTYSERNATNTALHKAVQDCIIQVVFKRTSSLKDKLKI